MSGMAPTEGGSLASATSMRTARVCVAAGSPAEAALTVNSCAPSCASPGTHKRVPFGRIAAPSGAPASEYDPGAAPAAFKAILTSRCSAALTGGTGPISNGGAAAVGAIHRAASAASEAAAPRAGSDRSAAFPLPSMMAAPGPSVIEPAAALSRCPGPAPAAGV